VFLDSVLADAEVNLTSHTPDYTIAPPPPSIVIPDYVSSAIKKELLTTWGCATPRPYQVEAIFHLVYRKVDMVYLIRKTGEGKSLVLQAMASMLKGVTISLVPLLGLGSDQQQKCNLSSGAVEAYHLDEFRGSHAKLLMAHLRQYTRAEKTTIILFVSPQQLKQFSTWYSLLLELASRGCISAVCIDEVHTAVQNYESFRPEFRSAMDFIHLLVSTARTATNGSYLYVPILAMSATFTISDQASFNKLIRRQPTMVFWGDMNRRNITFNVQVAGNPTHLLMSDWTKVAATETPQQSIVYSNSAMACDDVLIPRLTSTARSKIPFNHGVFLALTGDCGLMLKWYLMAAFCRGTSDANEDNATLPTIWCMPCTSAANCGVSSTNCTACFRIGRTVLMPPTSSVATNSRAAMPY
jgi:superfamily II DNA helicase RecQ